MALALPGVVLLPLAFTLATLECPPSIDDHLTRQAPAADAIVLPLLGESAAAFGGTEIPVALHLVRQGPGLLGDVPLEEVERVTVDRLNAFYDAPLTAGPFHFVVESVEIIDSPELYNVKYQSPTWSDFVARHRSGGLETLNLFVVGQGDYSGWATYPWQPLQQDHLLVRYLPETGALKSEGTMIHEVGHWLGLLHTFDGGGCSGSGDGVDDTPAQAADPGTMFACEPAQDSCPAQPGLDPTDNIMSYSYCRTRLTYGQKMRMAFYWQVYRRSWWPSPKGDAVEPVADEEAAGGCSTGGGVGGAWLAALALLLSGRRPRTSRSRA